MRTCGQEMRLPTVYLYWKDFCCLVGCKFDVEEAEIRFSNFWIVFSASKSSLCHTYVERLSVQYNKILVIYLLEGYSPSDIL